MSEQNNAENGPLRPQVIDLDAEEISTDGEADRPATDERPSDTDTDSLAPPPAQKRNRRGMAGWIGLALILGLLAGGWLYRDVLSSYFPSGEMTAMKARLDAMEANGNGLAEQLASLRQAAEGAAQAAGTAGEQAQTAAEQAQSAAAGLADLDARLGSLDQRIASAEAAVESAKADLDSFRKSVSTTASPAASGPVADTAALTAIGQRIDALEKDVASLKSSAASGGGDDKASVTSALSQALADLKAKVAAGAPYAEEHDRIARMVPAAAGIETVGAHAAEGLPNAQGLAQELRAAIPALPQPAPPPAEDDSYLGTVMKSLSGIVTIRPIGETDWPGIAEKAAGFAEAGDLNQAIAAIDGAEGDKPVALTQWRDRAAARLQLDASLAQLSEAVLRQIAALGGAAQ